MAFSVSTSPLSSYWRLLLLVALALFLPVVQCVEFALVRQDTRLGLVSTDNTSTFDVVREGRLVDIELLDDMNCSITTYKQASCNLLGGEIFYNFDGYRNASYANTSLGDATVVISNNESSQEIAICARIALRTLCPTFSTTEYVGSNDLYAIEEKEESITVFHTFGSDANPPWCVGICVDDNELCFKFASTNLDNCTHGNEWIHIAPSTDQISGNDGVSCRNKCSAADWSCPIPNAVLTMAAVWTLFII